MDRVHLARVVVGTTVIVALAVVSSLPVAEAASGVAVILSDGFDGTATNTGNWHIPTWVSPTDGTYVGRTQFRVTQHSPLPAVSNGSVNITVETHNPTGFSFYGTDLISNRSFMSGEGLDVAVRAKMDASAPAGVVGGIFLYALKPGSNTLHDEIDFELLGNQPKRVQTNIYADESLGAGNPASAPYPSGSITDYHVYRIKWLPNQVSWYVDGHLVRTETSHVPTGPMYLHLNMWVPDSGWPAAYDAGLQPTSSPGANRVFSMSVASVTVTLADTIPPVTSILGVPSGWTNRNVSFALTATDRPGGSGVKSTLYTFNGGSAHAYTGTVTVSAEGQTAVSYRSVDNADNTEGARGATIKIDKTAPATTDDHVATYTGTAAIHLSATDTMSGVATTRYSFDGGVTAYTGTTLTTTTPGSYALTYWSVDRAGNRELATTRTFAVLGPTALTISIPPAVVSYARPLTLSGKLTSGTRALSGVLVVPQYSYDNAQWSSLTSTRTDASGTYRLSVTPTKKACYRAYFAGSGAYMATTSATRSVAVRAYLSAPSPSATPVRAGTLTPVSGYLKPKHTAGARDVVVQCYRLEGSAWVYKSTTAALNADYSTYTRHSAALAPASIGSWRLRAYHASDTANAATYSSWTTVTVAKGTPALATAGAGTIAYGTTRTLSGTLKNAAGTALPGRIVTLKWAASPAATTWTSVASTRTVSTGAYTFRVSPATSRYYRASFAGDTDYLAVSGTTLSVVVQAYLSAPTFSSTVYINRGVTAAGYLKPKHTAGLTSIQLHFYRYEGGAWVYKKTAKAANGDYSTYTRYAATTSLASAGNWAVRAYHAADSANAATYSGWTTFTVYGYLLPGVRALPCPLPTLQREAGTEVPAGQIWCPRQESNLRHQV
jgi:beta-glucanase (GH16 family)